MADVQIITQPANKHAGANDQAHYQLPVYEWFGESANYSFPESFYPDLGDHSTEEWLNSVVRLLENPDDYVTKRDPLWQTPDQPNADNTGFDIKKPPTIEERRINIRIDGGVGHWMPAPIFRSLSFYWENPVNANANWRVYTPGLVLRHWETNEEKIWTAGWQEDKWGLGGRLKRLTNESKAYPVNNLGPDWYIYGAIFNCKSNSTSGVQGPTSYFRDFRLGWYNHLPSGSYRLIIPDKMSWDDFRQEKAANNKSFYAL